MRLKGHLVTTALLTVVALAVATLAIASWDAQAQLQPELRASIIQEDRDQTARPTDVTNDLLTFDGEVTLQKVTWFPGEQVVVEVQLDMQGVEEVWEANINPPEMTFTASGSKNFTAVVTVPIGLASGEFHTLFFEPSSEDLPNPPLTAITPGTANVVIAQHYKIGRQYSTEPLRVTQGDMLEFNITLVNRGNGADTFILEVTNHVELDGLGLNVIFEASKRVDAGEEREVRLRIEAADDAVLSEAQINLTIRSEGSTSDPLWETVVNGAEWTVVVEPSLVNRAFEYWYLIVAAAAALVALGIFLSYRRRKRREEAEVEAYQKRMEEAEEEVDEDDVDTLEDDLTVVEGDAGEEDLEEDIDAELDRLLRE